jgi:hypothetical protein
MSTLNGGSAKNDLSMDKTRFEKHLGALTDAKLKMQIQDALRFQLEL